MFILGGGVGGDYCFAVVERTTASRIYYVLNKSCAQDALSHFFLENLLRWSSHDTIFSDKYLYAYRNGLNFAKTRVDRGRHRE